MMLLNSSTRLNAAQGSNADLGRAAHHAAARRFDVLRLNRLLHVLRAQVVGIQLVQIDVDVDLAQFGRR